MLPTQNGFTQAHALGCLLTFCLVYVLPLHVLPNARAAVGRSRDDPGAIHARIRAVSFSTSACSLVTFTILALSTSSSAARKPGDLRSYAAAGHYMGYWPVGLSEAAASLLLTALLFAGPLFERLFIDGAWHAWLRLEPLSAVWSDWPSWRNFVAGPITEECLFRSAAVPLLLLAGNSLSSTIYLSPLVFGLAHVHHFYEFRITNPQVPLLAAVARSVLQFSYTYLFGIYATFLFLRTGSLLAVILVHAFCNAMGLPRVWGLVEPHWLPLGASDNTVKSWTAVYYLLLVGGAVTWWRSLYTLTSSPMGLAQF